MLGDAWGMLGGCWEMLGDAGAVEKNDSCRIKKTFRV